MTAPLDPRQPGEPLREQLKDQLSDRRDLAAYWHERLRDPAISAAERADFAQWCAADPRNQAQYDRLQALWAVADTLPASAVRQLGTATARPAPPRRQWWGHGLGLAAALALLWILADPLAGWMTPTYEAVLRTAAGERRVVALPDGSTLTLNTATEANVALYRNRRTVTLQSGDIFFQVDGTQGTPFTVTAGDSEVRVTGTAFQVRHQPDLIAVDVLSGSVQVSSGPWWHAQRAQLRARTQARLKDDGSWQLAAAPEIDSQLAWRDGQLVLRSTPLTQAVREINRYSPGAIAPPDAALGAWLVSGVFNLDDPAAFLNALPRILPVTVERPAAGGPAVLRLR